MYTILISLGQVQRFLTYKQEKCVISPLKYVFESLFIRAKFWAYDFWALRLLNRLLI